MVDYSVQNKKAWEYNAYEFWLKQDGSPSERAKKDRQNPVGMLKQYSEYFDTCFMACCRRRLGATVVSSPFPVLY